VRVCGNDVVCVALCVLNKGSISTGYESITIYTARHKIMPIGEMLSFAIVEIENFYVLNVRGVYGIHFIVCNLILITKENMTSCIYYKHMLLNGSYNYCVIQVVLNIIEVFPYVNKFNRLCANIMHCGRFCSEVCVSLCVSKKKGGYFDALPKHQTSY
jgi:hypothetical protein